MDTDSHFNAAHGGGAYRAACSAAASKRQSDGEWSIDWPALKESLRKTPNSRPGAVERARSLIADPDYPFPEMQQILAGELAVRLWAEIDSLPT